MKERDFSLYEMIEYKNDIKQSNERIKKHKLKYLLRKLLSYIIAIIVFIILVYVICGLFSLAFLIMGV